MSITKLLNGYIVPFISLIFIQIVFGKKASFPYGVVVGFNVIEIG